jgi:cytochrome c-type biogenesis protein CcmH/NrfG
LDIARKALRLDNDEPWAHLALGFVLAWSGRVEDAVMTYEKMLELDPNFAYGHTLLRRFRQQQEAASSQQRTNIRMLFSALA